MLVFPGEASAQKKKGNKDQNSPFTRTNAKFLEAFRDVVAPAGKSTVRVLCDADES